MSLGSTEFEEALADDPELAAELSALEQNLAALSANQEDSVEHGLDGEVAAPLSVDKTTV